MLRSSVPSTEPQTGQERTAIELHGLSQPPGRVGAAAAPLRRRQGGLELGDIGGHRRRVEADAGAVGLQDGSGRNPGRFQLVAEGGEGDAQAVAAGLQVALGPEELDEVLAGMLSLAKIGQVGEQGADALEAEAGHDPVALPDPQASEQLNATPGVHTCALRSNGVTE